MHRESIDLCIYCNGIVNKSSSSYAEHKFRIEVDGGQESFEISECAHIECIPDEDAIVIPDPNQEFI